MLRRKMDKVLGALFLASFFLNVAICIANGYWMARFIRIVSELEAIQRVIQGGRGI